MDILIETKIFSYRKNKDQRGDSFRTDEKKGKISALEWDDFVLQKQLKSFIYVERSLRSNPIKENWINELNFKIACV